MSELEQRLAAVEQELQQLKKSSGGQQQSPPQQTQATIQQGALHPPPAADYQGNPTRQPLNQQQSMGGPQQQVHHNADGQQHLQQNPVGQQGTGAGQQHVQQSVHPAQQQHAQQGVRPAQQHVQQVVAPGQQPQHLQQIARPAQQQHVQQGTSPGQQQHVQQGAGPRQPQHLQHGAPGQQQYFPNHMQPNLGNQPIPNMVSNQPNKASGRSMENILVRYVLPIVFIIILLIGILMLFIAGVAFGLITEPVRCILGLLLATAMYVTGMLQHQRSKRPILGKALLGGAHGVLIITISIAHLSYELFGVVIAAAFYVLSSALIIYSAIRWRSQLLVCIAIFSAYLCVYLIDIQNVHAIPYLLVQLVISISMMLLSSALKYRYAHGIAYFLLHFSLIITSNVHSEASNGFLIAALLAQHLVVFIQYMKRKQLHAESHVMQAVGVLAIISWTAHIYGGKSTIFLIVSIIIAAAYAVAILFFERGEANEEHEQRSPFKLRIEISTLLAAFALICFFINLLGTPYTNLILYGTGVTLVLYGLRDNLNLLRWFGAAALGIGTVSIMFEPLDAILSYEMLCWIVVLASFPVIYRECKQTLQSEEAHNPANVKVWLSTILWIEAALAFWFITIFGNLVGELIGTSDSRPYFVSFAWLLYAIIAIAYGATRSAAQARLTGIILLLVIAFKVVFIDITFLNILIKSILFTVLGGVGILVSYLLYNKTDDQNKTQ